MRKHLDGSDLPNCYRQTGGSGEYCTTALGHFQPGTPNGGRLMARMRSIKPEFWADQDLTRLPRDLRLLYLALWNFADEEARMQGDPRLVKSWCFPLDDDVTAKRVDGWLDDLADAGKIVRYAVDGYQYMWLPKLPKHQKLDPRLVSRLPAPPDPNIDTDELVRAGVDDADAPRPEGAKHVAGSREHVAGSREHVAGSREQGGARGARLPEDWTPDPDLIEAMRDEGIPDDLARRELLKFRDYWRGVAGAKGSKADWPATWRNWLRRAAEDIAGGRAAPNGAGRASAKAAGWLALGEDPQHEPLRALPGATA